MNKIRKLYDEKFVTSLLKKKVLPHYPDFIDIKKIEFKAHKNHIWGKTYHVVFEFKTSFLTKDEKIKKLPIFCSAHFSKPRENRRNLYIGLKYLWNNGFGGSYLTVPHPLFYSRKFKAAFYRGVKGKNFYQYIKENNQEEIEKTIPKIASWFAKLHKLPSSRVFKKFNLENSRIRTVIPGQEFILKYIEKRYPSLHQTFARFYDSFIRQEEEFFVRSKKRYLIHGDAHPENIIKMSERKIAMIDLNDMCLSDFARDLGCFLQQFEYMAMRKIGDEVFIEKMKKLFLDSYLKKTEIELDEDLQKRIDNYYNWTATRTATFLLLKAKPELDRGRDLLEMVKNKINI